MALNTQARQNRELDRVHTRIAGLVRSFFAQRLDKGGDSLFFYLDDLESFVMADETFTTPGSAGRIMRSLRSDEELDYRVVNRAKSLYEIKPILTERDLILAACLKKSNEAKRG